VVRLLHPVGRCITACVSSERVVVIQIYTSFIQRRTATSWVPRWVIFESLVLSLCQQRHLPRLRPNGKKFILWWVKSSPGFNNFLSPWHSQTAYDSCPMGRTSCHWYLHIRTYSVEDRNFLTTPWADDVRQIRPINFDYSHWFFYIQIPVQWKFCCVMVPCISSRYSVWTWWTPWSIL